MGFLILRNIVFLSLSTDVSFDQLSSQSVVVRFYYQKHSAISETKVTLPSSVYLRIRSVVLVSWILDARTRVVEKLLQQSLLVESFVSLVVHRLTRLCKSNNILAAPLGGFRLTLLCRYAPQENESLIEVLTSRLIIHSERRLRSGDSRSIANRPHYRHTNSRILFHFFFN